MPKLLVDSGVGPDRTLAVGTLELSPRHGAVAPQGAFNAAGALRHISGVCHLLALRDVDGLNDPFEHCHMSTVCLRFALHNPKRILDGRAGVSRGLDTPVDGAEVGLPR